MSKTLHSYSKKSYLSNFNHTPIGHLEAGEFENVTDKRSLRSFILQIRNTLDLSEVQARSGLIANNLFQSALFKNASQIGIYYPIRNEVDTKPIHQTALKYDKHIYYPRVSGDLITYHEIKDCSELKPGAFGIPEPEITSKTVSLDKIDLFIVPGICFDYHGNRIGYGRGYYDRTLKVTDKTKKIGLAYSFQIVEIINTDMDDMPLGYIVTENGVIDANEGGH